jgi:hypothetical protein
MRTLCSKFALNYEVRDVSSRATGQLPGTYKRAEGFMSASWHALCSAV